METQILVIFVRYALGVSFDSGGQKHIEKQLVLWLSNRIGSGHLQLASPIVDRQMALYRLFALKEPIREKSLARPSQSYPSMLHSASPGISLR